MKVKQTYQFLYWDESFEYDEDGQMKEKIIRCKKVQTACRKFLKWTEFRKKPISRVDYEIRDAFGKFIDIGNEKGFESLI